jgi:hypothetical protein
MVAIVIKNVNIMLIIILLSSLLFSCKENKIPLQQLNMVKLDKNPYTYSMSVKLEGKVKCPITLVILMDGIHYDSILFYGHIDTIFYEDWYENELSFKVYPTECIEKGSTAEVKLYK